MEWNSYTIHTISTLLTFYNCHTEKHWTGMWLQAVQSYPDTGGWNG